MEMRRTFGLKDGWAANISGWTGALKELQNRIESKGIILVASGIVANNTRRKLDPNEFRGFVLVDNYAPLVFVNGVNSKAAQMFTLGHELAHIWLDSSAIFDLKELQPACEELERVSNMIAAEFLVPENKLREIWFSARKEPGLYQALKWFDSTVRDDVIDCYRGVMSWVYNQTQFLDKAKRDFANGADGWLVAYAKAGRCVVVTQEQFKPSIRIRFLFQMCAKHSMFLV